MSYVDRRREVRYCVDFSCIIHPDKIEMRVNDVSIHGISIIGGIKLYQLHSVTIEIKLGLWDKIKLKAIVRDCNLDGDSNRYGLELFDMPKKWIKLVETYARKNGEQLFA